MKNYKTGDTHEHESSAEETETTKIEEINEDEGYLTVVSTGRVLFGIISGRCNISEDETMGFDIDVSNNDGEDK